ncbi:MAG: hypothetical protein ACEQSA_03690 [Weeksellaceae bacterium]
MWKYIGIGILLFLVLQMRAAMATDWKADLTLPVVGVTSYCLPGGASPTIPLVTGQVCSGSQVRVNVHYNDNTTNDSGVKAYAPLGINCAVGPTITLGAPQAQVTQTCLISIPTGPAAVRTRDAAGNTRAGTIQATFLQPWYRIKAASFHKAGTMSNLVPAIPSKFSNTDTDEGNELQQFFLMGQTSGTPISEAGVVTTQDSTIDIGAATKVSRYNWRTTSYTRELSYGGSINDYISYVKARKGFTTIASIADAQSDTINILPGNLTLDNTVNLGTKNNFVLVVQGDVSITSNFNTGSPAKNIAIMSTGNININSTVSAVNAILIASEIDTASDRTSANPGATELKVKGNLISFAPIEDFKRRRSELQRPSVYIVQAPDMYTALLPYLSTTAQEGRTIE